jgi:hypothetical protein
MKAKYSDLTKREISTNSQGQINMARAVIINVSGEDSVNGVADETLVAGPWDPATIGISGGVNADYFPGHYSEDFTPGGTTGFFMGHWPDGLGGQFSAIKVNAGFVGDFVIQSPYFYSLGSGTPTVSPSDGFVLSAVTDQAGLTVYEDAAKRVEVGYLSAGVFGLKAYDTGGSNVIFEASDTQQMIGGVLFDDGALFSTDYVSNQQGFKIFESGSAEFENIVARGEFRASVMVQDEVHALGGQFMANTAGVLVADMTTVTSPTTFTMDIKDPPSGHNQLFAVNDLVRVKDGSGKDNYIRIDSASDQTTFYRYTCTKQNGTNGTFYAGTSIVYWGTTTVGNLLNIVGVGTDAPYIDIFSHTGSPWSSVTANLRLGNLDGIVDADFTNLGGYGLYADNIFLKGSYQSSAGSGKRITLNEDEGSGANNAMIFYVAGGEAIRLDENISGGGLFGIKIGDKTGVTLDSETIAEPGRIEIVRKAASARALEIAVTHTAAGTADNAVQVTYVASELDTTDTIRSGIVGSATVTHASSDLTPVGLLGSAANAGLGDAYGVYGTASVTGSGKAYAGYFAAGDVYIADNLGVGTSTMPHGGVGYAKLAIEGVNASSAGPHVQFTTASDDYPLLQISPWSHDNIWMMFDAYYDGTNRSSDAGSNFKMQKAGDKLRCQYDSGVAKGGALSWNDGLTLDLVTGNVGIRTSTPGSKLQIQDSEFSLSSTTLNGINLQADSLLTQGDYTPGIGFYGFNLVNEQDAGIAGVVSGADVNQLGLAFFTHPSATGSADLQESMRIDHLGNVGRNTTSPNAGFDNNGTTRLGDSTTNYMLVEADGDVVFVGGAGLQTAGISVKDNVSAVNLSSASKTQFIFFDTNDASNGDAVPDHTNDHITVGKAGLYQISASITARNNAAQTHDLSLDVYINNGATALNNLHAHRTLSGGATNAGSISLGAGNAFLDAGDTVELWAITNSASPRSVTLEDVVLTVTQLGGN